MKFSKTLSVVAVTLGVGIIATEAQPVHAKTTTHAIPKTLQGTWLEIIMMIYLAMCRSNTD